MRSHFQIVATDAEQPYLARLIADNGEQVWRTSENYANSADAERAVCIVVEALYLGTAKLRRVVPDLSTLTGTQQDRIDAARGEISVEWGSRNVELNIPVTYHDERRKCRVCGCSMFAPCSPPCYWVADDLCSNPACLAATNQDRDDNDTHEVPD